jgi:hypothetical protein
MTSRWPRGLRPRRSRLYLETLEPRLAPDTRAFAGLDFTATQFNVSGNQVSSASPVTVAVAGDSTQLLSFSGGVTFQSDDASGSFTPLGTVSAVVPGQADMPLLNANSHPVLKASDLLGSGATIAAADTQGVTVPVAGASLTVGSIEIGGSAGAHVLELGGSVALTSLGNLPVSLPQQVFVQVDGSGVHLGTDFDITLPDESFTKGGLTVSTQGVEIKYDSANQEFDLRGAGSFTLPAENINNPVAVHLGDPSQSSDFGIQVQNGTVKQLDLDIDNTDASGNANSFTIRALTITPQSLHITYAQTTDSNNQTHDTYTVTGAASFTVGSQISKPVVVQLGTPATATTPETTGLVITDGTLTRFDMLIDNSAGNSIQLGALTLTPLGLHFVYQRTTDSRNQKHDTFTLTGAANLTLGSEIPNPVTVELGTLPSASDPGTSGLVVTEGALTTSISRSTATRPSAFTA